MANELAKALAEAKKKMIGNLQPSGGKVIVFVKGEIHLESLSKNVEVREA